MAIFTGIFLSISFSRDHHRIIVLLNVLPEHLKFALNQEVRDWIVRYGQACNAKYRKEMNEVEHIHRRHCKKRLSRPS